MRPRTMNKAVLRLAQNFVGRQCEPVEMAGDLRGGGMASTAIAALRCACLVVWLVVWSVKLISALPDVSCL